MLDCTKDKISAVKTFIKSIKIQLSLKPAQESAMDDFLENDFFQLNSTCYFLNSVILELLIKIFWEIEKSKECPHTHSIENLYSQLSKDSQDFLSSKYTELKIQLEHKINSSSPNDLGLNYSNFETILSSNKKVVMDYKYEMKPNSENSVFNNMVSVGDHYYMIPYSLCEQFFLSLLARVESLTVSSS